jgi:hypothetical protein
MPENNTTPRSLSNVFRVDSDFLQRLTEFDALVESMSRPTPPDPAETVEIPEDVEPLLDSDCSPPEPGFPPLEFRVRVHRVVPCPECLAWIVQVKFHRNNRRRICDGIKDCNENWFANILIPHDCGGAR